MKYGTSTLCLLFTLIASGCIPNAVTYYRPTVVGGTIITPHCVPTESIIEFSLPDAYGPLYIRAWADNGKNVNQVSLFFSGAAWDAIHFSSTQFRIRDLEKNVTMDASSVMAYRSDSIRELTTDPYLAPPQRPGLFRFNVQVRSKDPLPKKFELICPSIVIDDIEIKFPPIRFEQDLWMGISPFNC